MIASGSRYPNTTIRSSSERVQSWTSRLVILNLCLANMTDFIINSTRMAQPPHPFYPVEANIVGYLANEFSVLQLLGLFGAGCAVILGFTLVLVRAHNPRLPSSEKATILWFVLCKLSNTVTNSMRMLIRGSLHSRDYSPIFRGWESSSQYKNTCWLTETGYFAYNHASMPSMQDLFGQLWKEYAMSDSRYLTSDPFVLCMETVTAVGLLPISNWLSLKEKH